MPKKIKFPYKYKVIDYGRIVDPVISLEVATKEAFEEYNFLVDSGADTTTIPLYFTKLVKTEINRAARTIVSGVEDKGVAAYPGKIWIRIDVKVLPVRCYFIESDVIPLLGRVDIWDKYTIIFDNMRKEVVFEKI